MKRSCCVTHSRVKKKLNVAEKNNAHNRYGGVYLCTLSKTWGFETGLAKAWEFGKTKEAKAENNTKAWCPEEDSNLHTLRHTDLNRARLPIPPSGH